MGKKEEITLEQALEQIEALKTEKTELLATIEDMQQVIEAKSLEAKNAKNADIFVNHGKQLYKVLVPRFRFKKQEYLAKDLESNPKLIAELVELGPGILEKVIETK